MHKILLPLTVIALLVYDLTLLAQDESEDTPKDVKVKTVTHYKLEEKFGEVQRGTQDGKWIYRYTEKGELIEEGLYENDGHPFSKWIYKYKHEDNGRQTERIWYNDEGKMVFKNIYKYDKRGYLIEDILHDEEDKPSEKISYRYDDKGRKLEENASVFLIPYKLTWKYDKDGRQQEKTMYIKGQFSGREAYKYADGKLVEELLYNDNRKLEEKVTYSYDPHGNRAEMIRYKVTVKAGKPVETPTAQSIYAYEFYEPRKAKNAAAQSVPDTASGNNFGTLGETATDEPNDPTWTSDAKLGGNALLFDGKDDYVNIGNRKSLKITGSLSIEAWIKTDSTEKYSFIVSKRVTDTNKGYELFLTDGKIRMGINNGSSYSEPSDGPDLRDKKWHHLVGTYDHTDGVIRLFVDGVAVLSPTSHSGGLGDNEVAARIGLRCDNSAPFKGIIDELAIWNRPLTEADVAVRYNKGVGLDLTGSEAGLISVWHMNGTAEDASKRAEAELRKLDADKDGRLSSKEWTFDSKDFLDSDKNGDGYLDREEIVAYFMSRLDGIRTRAKTPQGK